MASLKVLERFIEQLERLAELGRGVNDLTSLVGKYEANSLMAVLNKIKPIMPFIDGPLATREEWVSSDNPGDRQTFYYKEPGIVLVNNFESTVRDPHGRMVYSGYKICFTRSGKLVQLDRRGAWSDTRAGNYWSSDAHELDITSDLASRHLPECVRAVVNAMERSVASHREKREDLRKRIALLKGIAHALETDRLPGESDVEATPVTDEDQPEPRS